MVLAGLERSLRDAVRAGAEELFLAIPEIIDYGDISYVEFGGAGASLLYDDADISRYYEYLGSNGVKPTDLDIADLGRQRVRLTNADGQQRATYSVLKSLVFDTTHGSSSITYHLTEGNWYEVENSYIAKLSEFLDPHCLTLDLPDCWEHREDAYNAAVAAADSAYICLDKKNISPKGQTQVEPCDVYGAKNGRGVLVHIKKSTMSSELSHLFNQGTNAVELLKSDKDALMKLTELISNEVVGGNTARFTAPVDAAKFEVVFGIITQKPATGMARNLPLFSRISLMRSVKALHLMGVPVSFGFIEDRSSAAPGQKKVRRKRVPQPDHPAISTKAEDK